MKKIVFLLVLMVLALSLWAGGGQQSGAGNEFSFWTLTSYQNAAMAVIDLYKQARPDVTINPTFNGGDPHMNNLMVAAASNTLPDIWFNWGGTQATFYSDNGLSYNLKAYSDANNWKGKIIPSILSLVTFGDQVVGFPINFNILEWFYRKDLFTKAGAKVPATFAEFEDSMAKLKAAGITPIATGGKTPSNVMRIIEALLEYYAGADGHDRLNTLEASWDSQPVIDTFAKFKEWIDKGYMPTGFLSLESTENKMLLYAGQAAMSLDGASSNSNLYNDQQDPSLYGYFKFPQSERGQRVSSFAEMMQINAKLSEARFKEAIGFVEFYHSPSTVAATGTLIKQPIPTLDNVLPAQLSMVPALIADLNNFGSFIITDQALPQQVCDILFQAQDSVAIGTMTPAAAAKFMQDGISAYKASQKR